MPLLRHRTVLDVTRGLKAFLRVDAGLTRGEVPDPERLLEDRTRQLNEARRRAEDRARRLERVRRRSSARQRAIAGASGAEEALGGFLGGVDLEALPEPVRAAARELRRELGISRASRDSEGEFRALAGKKGLKVHLGCGSDVRAGWVNVDVVAAGRVSEVPGAVYVNHDLRLGLPLEEGSCDYVYSSHFFEHLEYRHAVRLLRDCHRALRPGGVFRVALPTFKETFDRYVRGDDRYNHPSYILKALPDLEPGTETSVDYVNHGVYQNGEHKYIYDEEKTIVLLRSIGFGSVAASRYEEGVDPASEARRLFSFYVQAVK